MIRSLLMSVVILLAGCDKSADAPQAAPAAAPAVSSREGWPTEEEAKTAILELEYSINASETNKSIWHVKDLHHEVKSVQFAQKTTRKQMTYGASAIEVYPVKILYTRITEYTTKPATREDCGDDGVWFFYRDSFGNWACKYGNE
jgi:hypothetical protein